MESSPQTSVNRLILPLTGTISILLVAYSHLTLVRFVRGEGAVAIVIKPLEAALADNDYIYSVVSSNLHFSTHPISFIRDRFWAQQ